ncbi:MAG: hypothetical protein R3F34_12615 [Planctomycetota bacterium]
MKSTRIQGVHYWSRYQPDRRIDFNGFFVADPSGGVLLDPMPLAPEEVSELHALGGVRTILVTNADHARAAASLRTETGARIVAPACDRELLGDDFADDWFESSDDLPPGMSTRFQLAWLRGGKRPQEAAFWIEPCRAWYFGDAVRSHESGRLRLLPDPKIADRDALVASVRGLSGRDVQAILLGDGDCIFNGAREAFEALCESL